MDWTEITRRVAPGEDLEAVLEEESVKDRAAFDAYLRHECGRPDIADEHARNLREMDLGIYGARATWSALSAAQRRVLLLVMEGNCRVVRAAGSRTRYGMVGDPAAIRDCAGVATIRNLCRRELLAWDGGAFDPERAAVPTERGRFVVKIAGEDADHRKE